MSPADLDPAAAPSRGEGERQAERVDLAGGWLTYRAGDVWHFRHPTLGDVFEMRVGRCLPEFHELLAALAAREPPEPAGVARPGIYIASKAVHGPRWREWRDVGHPILSTWIDEAEAGRTTDWADLWSRCVSEAADAAVTIVYREDAEELKGARVEVGSALSHGRRVLVVGDIQDTWTRHPKVERVGSINVALAYAALLIRDAPSPAPARPAARDGAVPKEIRRVVLEEAADFLMPNGPRPCDCEHCDCGNPGDHAHVVAWDEAKANADAIRALADDPQPPARDGGSGEAENTVTYEIGERDGYERAVADIDRLTGGDGEYVCSIGAPSERHCPDPAAMTARIVERFEGLQRRARPSPAAAPAGLDGVDLRDAFEVWAVADSRDITPEELEDRTPGNGLYYASETTNAAYIGWREAARIAALEAAARGGVPADLVALSEAATPGPWEIINTGPQANPLQVWHDGQNAFVCETGDLERAGTGPADAAWIVAVSNWARARIASGRGATADGEGGS